MEVDREVRIVPVKGVSVRMTTGQHHSGGDSIATRMGRNSLLSSICFSTDNNRQLVTLEGIRGKKQGKGN